MTAKRLITIILTLSVIVAAKVQAVAQTIVTGDVIGTVTDQLNAVVADATVTLSSVDSGVSETAKTGTTGLFRFSLLKPGNYKILVAQTGFRKASQNVTVAIGSVATSNIQLQIGHGVSMVCCRVTTASNGSTGSI